MGTEPDLGALLLHLCGLELSRVSLIFAIVQFYRQIKWEEEMAISMDGSDPSTWDPALDAVVAAPENHTILYEDDEIRVLSVRVASGETEKPHHHRLPAVFVIDRMVKLRDFNGATNEEIPLPLPEDAELPITVKFLPQPLHYVENVDTRPFHAIRVEFKKGYPTGI
jgi:hypothetical protein